MNLRKKIFDQLVGKLKMSGYFYNYFQYVWHYVSALIDSPEFVEETNFEISKYDMKSGNPLLIDTTRE